MSTGHGTYPLRLAIYVQYIVMVGVEAQTAHERQGYRRVRGLQRTGRELMVYVTSP